MKAFARNPMDLAATVEPAVPAPLIRYRRAPFQEPA